jgi:hypothetical protein
MHIKKNIRKTVYDLLLNFPDTRDNNNILLTKFWETERQSNEFIALEYGLILAKFSKPETIISTRRKLQQKYPFLRGLEYEKRQIMGGEKKQDKIQKIEQYKFPFFNND